ncbi:unnamed protein product [Toxocara canis]|uniref:Inorganic diphosphatase n=1 Tax=Toxocara canis TaxID=6265 RepID=A0A183VA20_TOXCA|nr:unnamed protein product [Toxocara canis]
MQSSKSRIKTFKKILHAGRGELPEYRTGTKAIFHYETLKPTVDVDLEGFPQSRNSYETVDDTRKPYPDGYGKPLEIVFGKKFQLPVFETCIKTMLIDEVNKFCWFSLSIILPIKKSLIFQVEGEGEVHSSFLHIKKFILWKCSHSI